MLLLSRYYYITTSFVYLILERHVNLYIYILRNI